ncbi:hypothetical protein SCLCIDRAFT_1219678 [Scleroderma citrinum Foug A]|uniref:Uncharacterized protein n=1 Tax=Scleroderma citrinum Foug A TaxID=1036808 RepID=A0A0C2Z5J1_9AGAM|nr:hypothetical protein SCLCIDRAFT_1219678 [Scleroderma citrinum Foug A]
MGRLATLSLPPPFELDSDSPTIYTKGKTCTSGGITYPNPTRKSQCRTDRCGYLAPK